MGVTTAYELCRDGHEVSVFEQRSAAAEEASFANAGLLGPWATLPWATPCELLKPHLTGASTALRLASGFGKADLAWLWHWRRGHKQHNARMAWMEPLAQYSTARMQAIATEHALDFEGHQGRLVLLRTAQQQAQWQALLQPLQNMGVAVREISPDQARQLEPGLSPEMPLVGALHFSQAAAGNCRLLAQLLRSGLQEAGVQWHFSKPIRRLRRSRPGVYVEGESGPRSFDAVVVCAGAATAQLLQTQGRKLPMVSLYGYSVSAPLREPSHAPLGSVLDAQHHITITRLGQRVRIAGGAELGGHGEDTEHHTATLQKLYRAVQDWFPGGALLSSGVQIWRGSRPTLPDGMPILGATGLPGVWVNAGHGAAGWALAFGCARVLTDTIAQRSPEVDVQALGMQRF